MSLFFSHNLGLQQRPKIRYRLIILYFFLLLFIRISKRLTHCHERIARCNSHACSIRHSKPNTWCLSSSHLFFVDTFPVCRLYRKLCTFSKVNKLKRDMYAQLCSVKVHTLANILQKLFLSLPKMTDLKLFLNHGSSKHFAFVYLPSGPCACTITVTFESWNLHSLKKMIHSYSPLSPMI